MAENCTKAFGRYLKTLRERRSLSLDQVASLSQTFPEQINKGYLSRCENGHQKLGFAKAVPLSRIYQVESDVLMERMELDMDLERYGGPDTSGMTVAELHDAGVDAARKGRGWDSYGFMRDAIERSEIDSLRKTCRNREEQIGLSFVNCATAARALGRFRFPLHEYLWVQRDYDLPDKDKALLLERIATSYRNLGDLRSSQRFADLAIDAAQEDDTVKFLGYAYAVRALVAHALNQLVEAADYYQKAHLALREHQTESERLPNLLNLSQCYFDMTNYRASRQACQGAARLATELGSYRCLALAFILLGELDERDCNYDSADRHWRAAIKISKDLQDRILRFKAEFVLLRRALEDGNKPTARAIHRRMTKLSPWIPTTTYELAKFQSMHVPA